jgi:hypothetical protein
MKNSHQKCVEWHLGGSAVSLPWSLVARGYALHNPNLDTGMCGFEFDYVSSAGVSRVVQQRTCDVRQDC